MTCPTLLFTSGQNVWGLGTWDGGTKISLRLSTNFVATYSYPDFTFLYSTFLPGTISGYTGTIINMAVTDDGHAFMWVRTTGSFYRLVDHDIAAGTSTIVHTSIYDTSGQLAGPAWNPYDGYLYEIIDDFSGTYLLRRWATDGSGPTTVATLPRLYGFSRADMPVFTADGGIWFDIEDGGAGGESETVRYEGGELSFSHAPEFSLLVPVPRSASSVWTGHDGGLILNSDGSTAVTDCSLFTSGGTARVHCGINGDVTFLYPTSGGVGTQVYGVNVGTAPAAQWRIGRIGWPT